MRVGIQGLVKAKVENSPVSICLGLLHTKAVKFVFTGAFNAFIQSDFQQRDHVSGDNVL